MKIYLEKNKPRQLSDEHEQTAISDIHHKKSIFFSLFQKLTIYHIRSAPQRPPSQLALSKNRTNFLIITTTSCQHAVKTKDISSSKSICLLSQPGICFSGGSQCKKKLIHAQVYIATYSNIYIDIQINIHIFRLQMCPYLYTKKKKKAPRKWIGCQSSNSVLLT